MKKKSCIFLYVFALSIILISLYLVSASNPFEDFFTNSQTGILGFILSLVPVIVLSLITYLSLKKGSRSLMTLQVLLWWIFTVYFCFRAFAFLDVSNNLGFMPKNIIDFFISSTPTDDNQAYWYMLSIYVNAGIGLVVSLGNGVIRKIFIGTK